MINTTVLYHGDCIDGFVSAWQAWRKFEDAANYVAVRYQEPIPRGLEGHDVYVLDFCFSAEDTRALLDRVHSLTVLDHHKTAQAAMVELEPLRKPGRFDLTFDMERSGAGLARDYFHGGSSRAKCWIVDYVQDRDLWRFALPHSKTVNAYLHTLDFEFEAFEADDDAMTVEDAVDLGLGVEAYKDSFVKRVTKTAQRVTFAGFDNIPIVNAPYMAISEICNALAVDALFAVGWSMRGDGKIMFSLRSIGDFDVSDVAKLYGGGGHRNAAGFTRDDMHLFDQFMMIGKGRGDGT